MTKFSPDRELTLTRWIDAPRGAVYRCWTEAALLKQWFVPQPWTVPEAEVDVRPGGTSRILMRGPDGTENLTIGVYLEVVPDERLVFTDAFDAAWAPKSGQPFMLGIITLSDENGGTRYTAQVRHWTVEATQQHAAMGFDAGWGQCADQLAALARTL
ncbi:MAG TPA: SRPBCC family protein [Sphingomonas sp.]|uniref:SRPBCC family protein n=1 Tax=Sphingomonas sp. TaxID=28214 RepID=UPI002EDA891C